MSLGGSQGSQRFYFYAATDGMAQGVSQGAQLEGCTRFHQLHGRYFRPQHEYTHLSQQSLLAVCETLCSHLVLFQLTKQVYGSDGKVHNTNASLTWQCESCLLRNMALLQYIQVRACHAWAWAWEYIKW
jgi:hypothetical protein